MKIKSLLLLGLLLPLLYVPQSYNYASIVVERAAEIGGELLIAGVALLGSYSYREKHQESERLMEQRWQQRRDIEKKLDAIEQKLPKESRQTFHQTRPLIKWQTNYASSRTKYLDTTKPAATTPATEYGIYTFPQGYSERYANFDYLDQPGDFALIMDTISQHVSIQVRAQASELELRDLQADVQWFRELDLLETVINIQRDEKIAQKFGQKPLSVQYDDYIHAFFNDLVLILQEPYGKERMVKIARFVQDYSQREEFINEYDFTNLNDLTPDAREALHVGDDCYVSQTGITDQFTHEHKLRVIEAVLRSCTDRNGKIVEVDYGIRDEGQESIARALHDFVEHMQTDENLKHLPRVSLPSHQEMQTKLKQAHYRYADIYANRGNSILNRVKTIPVATVFNHPYNIALLQGMIAIDQGDYAHACHGIKISNTSDKEKTELQALIKRYAVDRTYRQFDDRIPRPIWHNPDHRHVWNDPEWRKLSLEAKVKCAHDPVLSKIFVNRYLLREQLEKAFGLSNNAEPEEVEYLYKLVDSTQEDNAEPMSPLFSLLHDNSPKAKQLRPKFFNAHGICKLYKQNKFTRTYDPTGVCTEQEKAELADTANRLLSFVSSDKDICAVQQQGLRHIKAAGRTPDAQRVTLHSASASMCLEYLRGNEKYPDIASFDDINLMASSGEIELSANRDDMLARLSDACYEQKAINLADQERATLKTDLKARVKKFVHTDGLPETHYLACTRAQQYLHTTITGHTEYERIIALEYAEAMVKGLEGDPAYVHLVTTNFATNDDIEKEIDRTRWQEVDEEEEDQVANMPEAPDPEDEEKKEEKKDESTEVDQETMDEWSNEFEKYVKEQKKHPRKTRLTKKDVEHILEGEYVENKQKYVGGHHKHPKAFGKKLSLIDKKPLRNGGYQATPYHRALRNQQPKTYFSKESSASKIFKDGIEAMKKGRIKYIEPKNPPTGKPIKLFKFIIEYESGLEVEVVSSPKGIRMYPRTVFKIT